MYIHICTNPILVSTGFIKERRHEADNGGVKKLRVYADTSVFGGCFDAEFAVESQKFFDEVRHVGSAAKARPAHAHRDLERQFNQAKD